jgi:antimicrobial peptide system SdpA family protein
MKLGSERSSRVLRVLVALACGSAWLSVLLVSIDLALPFNSLRTTLGIAPQIHAFVPQGWAFFTRDPREARLATYRQSGRAWVDATSSPVARPRNLFGLNREVRAQPVELASLLRQAPENGFNKCDGDDLGCLAQLSKQENKVVNFSREPTLCGKVGVVRRKPLPWAWRNSGERMPAEGLVMDVRCLNKVT